MKKIIGDPNCKQCGGSGVIKGNGMNFPDVGCSCQRSTNPGLGDKHKYEPGYMQFTCSIKKDTFHSPEFADVDIDLAIRSYKKFEQVKQMILDMYGDAVKYPQLQMPTYQAEQMERILKLIE